MLVELSAAVRDGRVHPTELVVEALRRIEALDGPIRSVVALRAEEALAEAARSTCEGPLAGIPFLVKDLADCAGLPTTYGSKLYADAPPAAADGVQAARLRAAGAIPIGKSNTPEFGWIGYTANDVFGATHNPWNLERSPGGSSGGSSAALAAALVPIATASDGGGSVRIPASLSGLVGYKPTIGGIGRDGSPRWMDFSTSGVLGRTVADVVTEAEVLLGPSDGDVLAVPPGAIGIAPERPRRALLCRSLRDAVDPTIEAALLEAVATIEQLGVAVEEIDNPIPEAVQTWFVISTPELAQSLSHLRDRWDQLDPGLRAMLRFGESMSRDDYIAARRGRYAACETVDRLLGAETVLITPVNNAQSWPPAGPWPMSVNGVDTPGVAVNTNDFNLTGHPAVSVPLGHDDAGVPFGMQVVAPRWRDGQALGIAAALEEARPWPLVAAGFEPFPVP
jgi:Asp-tRNA(Asn)/Glu-tRNA(Gln) amidotransferase A subunit family amidase